MRLHQPEDSAARPATPDRLGVLATGMYTSVRGNLEEVAEVEITTEVVPLTNPRALLGVLANLLFAVGNLGADTGATHPVDVVARVDGRVVGRSRAWTPQSLDAAFTAMKEDSAALPLEEFERRWR